MAFSVSEYLKMLLNLLPKGKVWPRYPDSTLYKLMHANAGELNRVDLRTDDLKVERDTRTTTELLYDHERDLGLPDDCVTSSQTITERRSSAHFKFIAEGGLHKQAYIDLAEDLGWVITIDEFTPFWCGFGECGDKIGEQINVFYWQVNVYVSAQSWIYFTCGSSQCGDPLVADIGTSILECILNKYKPAHTQIIWNYYGPEFSAAFNKAFNAIPYDDPTFYQGAFSWSFSAAFDVYQQYDLIYGQFNKDFNIAFDVLFDSGDFNKDAFDLGFIRPF